MRRMPSLLVVLLVSTFNRLRSKGMQLQEALCQGVENLVRPVLMTALAAIFGLLPAALSTRIGSQSQRPLAIVVVGGMLATLLLANLVPLVYSFYGRREPHVQRFEVIEDYQAESWSRPRRVVCKLECTPQGSQRRFVVTNLSGQPAGIYRGFYVRRGQVPWEEVERRMTALTEEAEAAVSGSPLPAEPDRARVADFLFRVRRSSALG